jgi:cell division protein ZapA (FtsZ GTPase activity inhibitor)
VRGDDPLSKRSVAVQIAGHEYRVLSDADEAWLQRVASYVDASMSQIRGRTGLVDSLDIAMLTCLNLARELLALREGNGLTEVNEFSEDRVRGLIELAESALRGGEAAAIRPPRAREDVQAAGSASTPPNDEADPDVGVASLLTLPEPLAQPDSATRLGPDAGRAVPAQPSSDAGMPPRARETGS